MTMTRRALRLAPILLISGCATLGALGQVIQAPRFTRADDRESRIELRGPSRDLPLGGATIRLWARVENPNPLGITLSTLAGNLTLEGSRAAQVSFPLGVPLRAQEVSVVPLELTVSFDQLGGLASVLTRAVTGSPLRYRLDGTVGVDAGPLGQPTFGPMMILDGQVRVTR